MCNPVCNYKNFVTFTVALYFSNDYDGAALAERLIHKAIQQAQQWENQNEKTVWNPKQKVKFALEDICKDYFEHITAYRKGIQWQIYRASLDMVDWLEIVEDILSE